jgi:hypothetical protein
MKPSCRGKVERRGSRNGGGRMAVGGDEDRTCGLFQTEHHPPKGNHHPATRCRDRAQGKSTKELDCIRLLRPRSPLLERGTVMPSWVRRHWRDGS